MDKTTYFLKLLWFGRDHIVLNELMSNCNFLHLMPISQPIPFLEVWSRTPCILRVGYRQIIYVDWWNSHRMRSGIARLRGCGIAWIADLCTLSYHYALNINLIFFTMLWSGLYSCFWMRPHHFIMLLQRATYILRSQKFLAVCLCVGVLPKVLHTSKSRSH